MAKAKPPLTVPASTESSLLLPEERKVCIKMAQGDAPHNHRALALIALDQGVTQADASELSGLTIGQVRYWRDKFRQQRLKIFPKDLKKKGKGSRDRVDSGELVGLVHRSDSEQTTASAPPAKEKAGKTKQDAKRKSGKKRHKRDENSKKKSTKKKKKESSKSGSKLKKKQKSKAKAKGKAKSKKKGKEK